ncbi:MAG: TnpV protein [Anaerovorax sp.]
MLELEYTEIDGLLYPNIETGVEDIENDLSKYGILRLRYLHEHKREMYRELLIGIL